MSKSNYDRRSRTAGQYDNRLKRAQSQAKSRWGSGWAHLSEEQQSGAVAVALLGEIAAIDFGDAFRGRLDEPGIAEKLLQKLEDLADLCGQPRI